MTRSRPTFRCSDCDAPSSGWVGRCPGCGAWGSIAEVGDRPAHSAAGAAARPVLQVDPADGAAVPTGVAELDRVLGGGLVPGSVTLLGGEPGVGKSTLLLQVAIARAQAGATVLYASAEESPQQVRVRAERLGALPPSLWLADDADVVAIEEQVQSVRPDLLVVDSVQTVAHPAVDPAPGTVTQVRACAQYLVGLAKRRGVATVLVGHVTKDGGLAGPRVLEHVVDTVLAFEGDRVHALRLLRAHKHRFGPTHELGLFEMGEAGLQAVPDASALFLADRRASVPGSVVAPVLDGFRPLLVEVQALVVPSSLPAPRRSALGLDSGRLALVLAVLQQRAGIVTAGSDVYASAVGGVRVGEPAADLAVALALWSANEGVPLPADVVACGEVGLGGELRQVGQIGRRLGEAARMGFRRALVPASTPDGPPGIELVRAFTVDDAVALAAGMTQPAMTVAATASDPLPDPTREVRSTIRA